LIAAGKKALPYALGLIKRSAYEGRANRIGAEIIIKIGKENINKDQEEELMNLATTSKESDTRDSSLNVLDEFDIATPDIRTETCLLDLNSKNNKAIETAADYIFKKGLTDERLIDPLINAITYRNAQFRQAVTQALTNFIDNPKVQEFSKQALLDKYEDIRQWALEMLTQQTINTNL